MKILFITPYPAEGPSSRYRVEQYIPYLKDRNICCVVSPFISSDFYKILYKRGHYFKKIFYFVCGTIRRLRDLFLAVKSDIVFIHLEAFPLGPALFEWLLSISGKRLIYDLDDAIYMRNASSANKFLKYLKWPNKIRAIIKISKYVITCNEHLADYARKFNKNVEVIPTSLDTKKFVPIDKQSNISENITIGWIGSYTTTPYLEELKNVFLKLSMKYKFDLKIVGAAEHNIKIPGINVINLKWKLEDDVKYFQSLDIGVYPLPENEWTAGKTGFKTIQYMSVCVPCVVSSVGANKYIVKDGLNGYLVNTEEEWIDRLSSLIEDFSLRKKIGLAGRKTVEEKFSLAVNAPRFFQIIEKVHKNIY